MGAIYETFSIDERLHGPVRDALSGKSGVWPANLTAAEIEGLLEHGVVPMVYRVSHLPQLRDLAIRAAGVEPQRLADLQEVLAALADRGIEVLVLKGSALAYDIYDAPELRPRGDTDLLISREAREATRQVLGGLGFREIPGSGDEHGVQQALFVRGPHTYDIHWSVANTAVFEGVLRFGELLERSVPLPRISAEARGLSHVDALLLACVHRVAHHHDSDRLIWLCDIALLRDRMSVEEHRRFWELAAERSIAGICERAVDLADEWMSRPRRHCASDYLPGIPENEPSRVLMNRRITRARLLSANLRALPWRSRARRVWQLAFPPVSFIRRSFGTRSRFALPWLYMYRGARGIARLLRRV